MRELSYEQRLAAWLQSSCCRDVLAGHGKPSRQKPVLQRCNAPKLFRCEGVSTPTMTIHQRAKLELYNKRNAHSRTNCASDSPETDRSHRQRHKSKQSRRHKKRGGSSSCKQDCGSTKPTSQQRLLVKDYYRKDRSRRRNPIISATSENSAMIARMNHHVNHRIQPWRKENVHPPRQGWM